MDHSTLGLADQADQQKSDEVKSAPQVVTSDTPPSYGVVKGIPSAKPYFIINFYKSDFYFFIECWRCSRRTSLHLYDYLSILTKVLCERRITSQTKGDTNIHCSIPTHYPVYTQRVMSIVPYNSRKSIAKNLKCTVVGHCGHVTITSFDKDMQKHPPIQICISEEGSIPKLLLYCKNHRKELIT